MTEDQIKEMAEEYIKDFDPMFKKAVRMAFIDGMTVAMKVVSDKLKEL